MWVLKLDFVEALWPQWGQSNFTPKWTQSICSTNHILVFAWKSHLGHWNLSVLWTLFSCNLSLLWLLNPFPHSSHSKILLFGRWTALMCDERLPCCVASWEHKWHRNLFEEWTAMIWTSRLRWEENSFPHFSHFHLTFSWTDWKCVFKLTPWENSLLQILHL